MAKEIFITQWFSEEMRLAGETLIKRLDSIDAQVYVAYWLLDDGMWGFGIISPLVGIEGPRSYYVRIDNCNELAAADEMIIALHDISVNHCDHKIIRGMKGSLLMNTPLENYRIGRGWLGKTFVEDMYLYRMDWNLLNNRLVAT